MDAIIVTGGKQYKVAEGDLILRFKDTDDGVEISKDILHFLK